MKRVAGILGLLVASPTLAQDDAFDLGGEAPVKKAPPLFLSRLETGFGYQSADSFHFARYGGITEKGGFPILSGLFTGRDPWTSDGTRFWNAGISILGSDLRDLYARYGRQGSWQVGAFYRGFTRNFTESAKTPFSGAGTGTLALPGNWVSGNSSQRFTALEQSLKPLELKTEWQFMGGDAVLAPAGTGYELRLSFNRNTRDGLRADATAFGHEANFPVGVFFPSPVDYKTHRMKAALSYADAAVQWSAGYELSRFDNGIKSVLVPNPYSRSVGPSWPAGAFAGFPFAVGQYSLPPDSTAHQVSLNGAYALTPSTRLTAKASYALHKQDDRFFPYTITPQLTVREPLPRASLDGKIHKTFLSVGLTSREWTNIDLNAAYTYDGRDNRTDRELYSYVPNDAQDQVVSNPPGISRYIRFNLPRSFYFHKARAEAAYRFAPRAKFSLAYTGDFKTRTYQQVEQTDEHVVKAKLQSGFEAGSAWVSYAYARRTGSEYLDDLSWNESHTLNYLRASPFNRSIEHPLLRTYHLADRIRHEAKAGATFDVTTALTFNASAGTAKDRYPHTTYGRQRSKSLLLDGDVTYAADDFSLSAFFGLERYRFTQAGYYMATGNLNNLNQVWRAENKDTIHSVGAKADWEVIENKLKLGAAYFLSDGLTEIDVQSTAFIPLAAVAPVPDGREITHNVKLSAAYNVTEAVTTKLGYTVEQHTSRDWQYDNIGLAPVAQILGSGIIPPRYYVHVVAVTLAYQF
jgi:MtrB/PioB family decaheme-associated outer membrane protein